MIFLFGRALSLPGPCAELIPAIYSYSETITRWLKAWNELGAMLNSGDRKITRESPRRASPTRIFAHSDSQSERGGEESDIKRNVINMDKACNLRRDALRTHPAYGMCKVAGYMRIATAKTAWKAGRRRRREISRRSSE